MHAGGTTITSPKFKFHCPACGKALNAPAASVGRRASCPHCKVEIAIPDGLCSKSADLKPPSISLPAAEPAPPGPPSWRDVVQTHRDFVPLIECAAGVGSGLLISRDGLVVTNRHVIERSRLFMLRFFDGSKAKGALVHTHGSRDLAVLRAAIRRERCFDIAEDVADAPEAGDDALAIGHPRGLAFTSTRGIVSEPRRRLVDGEYVQTDVAINPGNSGGPLLDRFGKLVGLNTQTHRDSEGLGFAIGGREVQAYALFVMDQLARRKLRMPSDEEIAAEEQQLTPWDIANAAVFASALAHRGAAMGDGQPCIAVQSPKGNAFSVFVGGNVFCVTGCIAADLPARQLKDPKLLLQLLHWQGELCGPCFEVSGANLYLGLRRSVEGLDVNEAREAILRVSDAFDALRQPIHQILGR